MESSEMACTELEETVWTGRGISPKRGTLQLSDNRLCFELDGAVAFDAALTELGIAWPWYGFGCQFWVHAAGRRYFISFLHPHNTLGSWAKGVRNGRRWYRAMKAILSAGR